MVSNLDAKPYETKTDTLRSADNLVCAQLVRQMTSPVRWQESVEYLATLAPGCFMKIGPGKVLSGLVQKILPRAEIFNFSESRDLSELAARLDD